MTGIDGVALQKVIIHKIGNPSRGEELQLSDKLLTIDDEIVTRLLTSYFLKPFNENELYQFTHLSDLSLNEVYTYISRLFENPESFIEQSALLAQFLYSKSTHSKVKEGELYVALFDEVPFEKETIQAIGIFKSETKETFLKLFPREKDWELTQEEGININKLDKGCLVFKTDTAEGFKVCVVDNTNKQQDAQYWVTDFLQVSPVSDSYHHTDKYLSLCKSFVTNEYTEKFEVSKSDQLELLNRSMDYFKTKEQFNLQEFTEEVIHHPEVVNSFMDYKRNFEASRQFEIEDEFDIHLAAVKKQQRVFKSVLKLDKNFHIYIHGRRDLIEKGVDEMTGKKYYKIFYDEES
ncbi:nucleoid-associated protein [Terrimonas pollutisoli]|uniref:nucleoid-associated protein n=1 Tax=Terrimonas pollutisoli TaxID=3034147 RepID=UPI0023EBB883|nr:nucleoid-associated protein [Terrimonas sp. H1YJ31]